MSVLPQPACALKPSLRSTSKPPSTAGGRVTSDGGLVWLAEVDRELGLCESIASDVPDVEGTFRQALPGDAGRPEGLPDASGYEDQNDADTLHSDPLLKLVLGRLPETDPDLASQLTLSRLENAPGPRDCARALVELYVRERGKDGRPRASSWTSTDDPTHGKQEGSRYHSYYGLHMYHPLLVFDGATDQLVTAVLRPGNAHASRGAVAGLSRIVGRLKEEWPEAKVEVGRTSVSLCPPSTSGARGRGGCTIDLVPNPRLEAIAGPLLERAQRESGEQEGEKVRLVADGLYEAGELGPRTQGSVQGGGDAEGHEHPLRGHQPPRRSAQVTLRLVRRARRDRGLDKGLQAGFEG